LGPQLVRGSATPPDLLHRQRACHPRQVHRIALIVNPYASGVTDEVIRRVVSELEHGAEVTTLRTDRARHGTELAREASDDGFDAIVGLSGDGGYNEILNGVRDGIPLGFVPGGGTSVLPRSLGLPRDPVRAARRIVEALASGRTRRISVGRVNGLRFAFQAGIGFDAAAVRRVDELGRDEEGRRPGDLAFVKAIGSLLAEKGGRFEPELEIEGFGRAAFAVVANTDPTTYAGPVPIHFTPQARFELGLDFVAPISVRKRTVARLVAATVLGRGYGRDRILSGHDLDRIKVLCDRPLPLQADGEDLGDVDEVLFECERDAVAVLV
jgi:diacylglycerol kinase family enzyme